MYIATRRARLEAREAGFLVLHKNNIFSDIMRFSDSFFGGQKCQLELCMSNGSEVMIYLSFLLSEFIATRRARLEAREAGFLVWYMIICKLEIKNDTWP